MIRNRKKNDPYKTKQKSVGEYLLGATLGEGTFGKVKHAIHSVTKKEVAIKILDKEKIQQQNMASQIKREVAIMKQIGSKENPHVVQLYEVLASRTKIYLVLELVTGGELFDKIVKETRFTESKARFYFRQLVTSLEFCHNLGVCHRDLKPENLLIDDEGNLKISDFGLSALYTGTSEDVGGIGELLSCRANLLHTTCGTPNYVAPEVLEDKGYDGRKADIWSMGVILYVLVSGCLPFDEKTLASLFEKIRSGKYSAPSFLSKSVKDLLAKILVPNPKERAGISEIKSHDWYVDNEYFGKGKDEVPCRINKPIDANHQVKHWTERSSAELQHMRELQFTIKSSKSEAIEIIRDHLEEMGCDLSRESTHKLKVLRQTQCGAIGLTVLTDFVSNDITKVEVRRGKGDIFLYNNMLNELVKNRLISLIDNVCTTPSAE